MRFGHTGWSNQALYRYDQTVRLRSVLHAVERAGPVLKSANVLDIGCGCGDLAAAMALRGAHVVAIDISPTVIAKAQAMWRHLRTISFLAVPVTRFEAPQASFDLVTSITVLQHQTDAAEFETALRSIRSLLRPGGSLLLLELAPNRPARCRPEPHITVRSAGQWIEAAAAAGLTFRGDARYPHYGVTAANALARRAPRAEASEPHAAAAAALTQGGTGLRQVALRALLGMTYVADHVLALPVPRRLALYRILMFERPKRNSA